jgi:hypothetical protein
MRATKQWELSSLSGVENGFVDYQTTWFFWLMSYMQHAVCFFSLMQRCKISNQATKPTPHVRVVIKRDPKSKLVARAAQANLQGSKT